ncbi:tetratricopeptide repeat protein [candidate division CSSED10-310 bacterium]|uniref:Tetratricopeptide repeat protein n=1 Tax=candidate division CSSED10-310 bacterium TaxID=2855610 RepID=A0ABV6YR84_UNCC1
MVEQPQKIGPYLILGTLGQGGMGIVYRGQHHETGENVALKTIKIIDEIQLESIRREVRSLARIQHHGIVSILEEGIHEVIPWYAMELLKGVTLQQYFSGSRTDQLTGLDTVTGVFMSGAVESSGEQAPGNWWTRSLIGLTEQQSMPPPEQTASFSELEDYQHSGELRPRYSGNITPNLKEIFSLVTRICAPLAYLHGEGMVHRDLKPANIIVKQGGIPVLVDFGLMMQFSGDQSREKLLVQEGGVGTVNYIAPEQIRGSFVDARADLYSLGCILYELITGQLPFRGENPSQIIWHHLRTVPLPPSSLRADVPAEIDELLLHLLAKDPRDRIGHADVVAGILARMSEGLPQILTGPKPKAYLYRSHFAGREEPLAALREHLTRLLQGTGSLVLVSGERGVGKTRLVVEFGLEAARQNVQVLTGECQEKTGRPLEGLLKLIQMILDRCRKGGRAETDRLVGHRGKVFALYESEVANLPGQELFPPPAELQAEAAQLRLFRYLSETLTMLAHEVPLLIILDDVQWADELTLGFLEFGHNSGFLAKGPIFILATHQDDTPGTGPETIVDSHSITRVKLERLDERAVATVVGDMLALSPPPELFCTYLAHQSEGNPLFVAEYLRAAVEEGILWRDDLGFWHVELDSDDEITTEERYQSLALPASLQGLIERRLGGLPPLALQVIRAAAIVGREAKILLLWEMTKLKDDELLPITEILFQHHLLEKKYPGAVRFVHDKVREVALSQIRDIERRQLHCSAAKGIETFFKDELDKFLSNLGRHWEEAGHRTKARPYYLQAARKATNRYAFREARRLYLAYFNVVDEPTSESIAARIELSADVLHVQGKNSEAITQLETAFDEARNINDRPAEAASLRSLGLIKRVMGRMEEARALFEQSLSIACDIQDRANELLTLANLAVLHSHQGRMEVAKSLHEQALTLARQEKNRIQEGVILGNMANLHSDQGRMEIARSHYEQALVIARETRDRLREGIWLGNLAALHKAQGRVEVARTYYEQAITIARQTGNRLREGIWLGNLAALHHSQGSLNEAQTYYHQALSISREVRNRKGEGNILANLAALLTDQGQLEKACSFYFEALVIAQNMKNRRVEGVIFANLAGLHRVQGQVYEAQSLLDQALASARELGSKDLEGYIMLSKATLDRQTTQQDAQIQENLARAYAILNELENDEIKGLCLCQQGHEALMRGVAAHQFIQQAQKLSHHLEIGPKSELGLALTRLIRAQETFEKGESERLFQGELIEDIPDGLRQWLTENEYLPP